MAELIDKWKVVDVLTALENEFQQYKPFHGFEHAMYRKLVEVEMEIGKMVAVEAEPVVHAHWEFLNDYQSRCSHCRSEVYVDHDDEPPYCERCGAHMDENLEIRTAYCPICDKHFEVRLNDSMGSCPDCGHHVVLHREGERRTENERRTKNVRRVP